MPSPVLRTIERDIPADAWMQQPARTFRDLWVEEQVAVDWKASFRLVLQDGEVVVSEIRVYPYEPEDEDNHSEPGLWSAEFFGLDSEVPHGGLTSTLLRKVPWIHSDAVPDILQWVLENRPRATTRLERFGITGASRARRKPGPKGPTDLQLAKLAKQYVDLVKKGVRNPITKIAERRHCGSDKIRDQVFKARERGLLTSPPNGLAGGHLTPYAEELLANRPGVR